MPEQANSVSSGLSPLLKTAKPGQADLTARAKSTSGKGSAFSNDLDQARKQQFDKLHAEAPQANNRKPGTEGNASVLTNPLPAAANAQAVSKAVGEATVEAMQSDKAHLANHAQLDVSGAKNIVGISGPNEAREPDSPLLSASSEVTRDTAPASNQLATGIAPYSDSESPGLSTVTTKLQEQQSTELSPVAPRTAALQEQQSTESTRVAPRTAALQERQSTESTPVAPRTAALQDRQSTESTPVAPRTAALQEQQSTESTLTAPRAAALQERQSTESTPTAPRAAALQERQSTESTPVAPRAAASQERQSTESTPVAPHAAALQERQSTESTPIIPGAAALQERQSTEPTSIAPRAAALQERQSTESTLTAPRAAALQERQSTAPTSIAPRAAALQERQSTESTPAAPRAAALQERQSTESTPVAPRAATLELKPSAASVNTLSSKVGEGVAPMTTAAQFRQSAGGADKTLSEGGVVAFSVRSLDEGLDLNAGRFSKNPVVEVGVPKPPVEEAVILTNATALAKGRSSVSGETGTAAMTVPEILVPGASEKNSASQTSAVGLTQQPSGNGILTQARLAGRFRLSSNELAAPGAKTPPTAGQAGLTQSVLPSLNGKGPERPAVGGMPVTMVDESLSDMDSLMGVTDVKQTVQQRIAMAEAMLSQMTQETSEVTVKAPAADNVLQALSGNTVTATVVQSSALATGPTVQAPLNINLMSADTETALAGNVKWMTNEGLKNAVMTVTPHGMGPISVKIGIDGDQMDVSIIASQHSTRDALESMLPRLREQLAVQGHETVKVDVSDGKSEQARSGNGQAFAESRNPAGASPQDKQSNSSNHGEKTEYGHSGDLEVGSDSVMAEDLQRVAARVVGETGSRPVFDAYV